MARDGDVTELLDQLIQTQLLNSSFNLSFPLLIEHRSTRAAVNKYVESSRCEKCTERGEETQRSRARIIAQASRTVHSAGLGWTPSHSSTREAESDGVGREKRGESCAGSASCSVVRPFT